MDFDNILKLASAFEKIAAGESDRWARGIIIQAFQKVMGREPTIAEAELVQAVAKLESNYGKAWGSGEAGQSHNWGAIQTQNPNVPSFSHNDTRPNEKGQSVTYQTKFRSYPDDVSGAADVVFNVYKAGRKQRKINMPAQNANGPEITDGPGRGEACLKAAEAQDIMKFSAAMFWTGYYEGFGSSFKARIETHAKAMDQRVREIAAANNETQAATIKSDDIYPITNDAEYLEQLKQIAAGSKTTLTPSDKTKAPQSTTDQNGEVDFEGEDTKMQEEVKQETQKAEQDAKAIDNELWFT